MSNALINHLEKTLERTEARVAELQSMLQIARSALVQTDPRQGKLPVTK